MHLTSISREVARRGRIRQISTASDSRIRLFPGMQPMSVWRKALSEISLWRLWRHRIVRLTLWLIRDRYNALGRKTFLLGGIEYAYFVHPYNRTWTNERAVEIPVARKFIESADPSSTLEIGNVLSHYFRFGHTVVDKYEECRFRPVINVDLIDFNPHQQFNAIVSLSTFEHIGWDEQPRMESELAKAFQKLNSLLPAGGKAMVTVPVGYNHFLDQQLPEIAGNAATFKCLKRVSEDNQWVEIDLDDALRCKYGSPFDFANALVFIFLKGKSEKPGDDDHTGRDSDEAFGMYPEA